MEKRKNTGHSFADYFKRATSTMVVLHLLEEKSSYAYEMNQILKERSQGKYAMSLLYPLLYRLEEQGFVEASEKEIADGRVRNYYAIIPSGRAHLLELKREYRQMVQVVDELITDAAQQEEMA